MNKVLIIFSMFFLFSLNLHAVTVKIAVLAPNGTTWAKYLKKMSKDVKKATGGNVRFKIYYGGSQGDEQDVLRKIRVGQLHGGIFTGKTLAEINGDVRVIEVPFTFYHDRNKANNVLKKMSTYFNEGFRKNGFKNLGFFELGQVYFISKKKAESIDGMKNIKIWLWDGDELVARLIKNLELVSVPLALTDVLTSLQTGMVEAAYAPPTGILAVQWHTKVKYLIDFPLAYSIGAFLVNDKSWKKIPLEYRKIVEEISLKYTEKVNQATVKDNVESLAAIKSTGIEFVEFSKKDIEQSSEIRKQVIKDLTGKVFSAKAINLLEKYL